MTQKSWPWSTVAGLGDGAAELNEALSREFLALYFLIQDPTVEGVSKGVLGELAVTGTATPLAVAAGSAVCYGLYINDASVNVSVTTPAIGTTGGRVVLQTNWGGTGGGSLEARTRIAVKMSADGNSAIPALTQSFGTTWEISLATFTVTTGGVITLTDDRTFRRSTMAVGTDELDNLGVTLAKLAADSVDDTKAGNRVAQFYRRQGGDASDWSVPGTTTRTPTAVRDQAGVIRYSGTSASFGQQAVTFPQAFSQPPIVNITPLAHQTGNTTGISASILSVTSTGFVIWFEVLDATSRTNIDFHWRAIGAE